MSEQILKIMPYLKFSGFSHGSTLRFLNLYKMNIHHIAIWTNDLENLRKFYVYYFDGYANEKYMNPITGFESYFIRFDSGTQLELMRKGEKQMHVGEFTGLAHFAFTLGSEDAVVSLTERLRGDGYTIAGEPRRTGDGYYESVILDPEGNRVELIA
jgi:lactoylglutathione lyase